MTRGLADFLGCYSIAREIVDRHGDHTLRFDGTAQIAATPKGAIYSETGKMTFPNGQAFQSERRYLWIEDGALIRVCFDDGRAFHDFDPQLGGAATEHLCGEDMYHGGYDFADWPRWSLTWSVSGPRKDYTSTTLYAKA